jgi:hypothetical protein
MVGLFMEGSLAITDSRDAFSTGGELKDRQQRVRH